MLTANEERQKAINAKFNPITGENSVGERVLLTISDFSLKEQWIPTQMMDVPLISAIAKAGSIKAFYDKKFKGMEYTADEKEKIVKAIIRVRAKYDFPFWAATFAHIKAKGGGEDILFRLNRPQRRLVEKLERMRLAGKPIRMIVLKARQWGGSTCIQDYMAWLQLVHKVGLNSLIVAHQSVASDEINDMYCRLIDAYPMEMLYRLGESYYEADKKYVGVGRSGLIHRVPQRKCKIKIGTAERPQSARGGDYNLVHLSEVGLWSDTPKKTAADIVRSSTSGILYEPYTMIVYESTANGTGNFFHREYLSAKSGKSQFEALFVPWFGIDTYSLAVSEPIDPYDERTPIEQFAQWIWDNREKDYADSDREEPGAYLWWLWQLGATIEGINWYIHERTKYTSHADMASEFPSDDVEAFAFSGRKVFNNEDIDKFRASCKPPKIVGEIYGWADKGENALDDVKIRKEQNGRLWVWQDVEKDEGSERVTDRYLVVVDVCKGTTDKADFAVIVVFDRLYMIDGMPPSVVAQWYGHIDMDLLAWKATQLAHYYNDALLVIESNTLETNYTKGDAEYILNVIKDYYENLYARRQSAEDIRENAPRKYGFHTNVLTKKVIINNLKQVIRDGLYVERDEGCLDEFSTYVETDNGGYEAMTGYHDDKLMTRAIGLHICYNEMEMPTIVNLDEVARRKERKKKKAISAATI